MKPSKASDFTAPRNRSLIDISGVATQKPTLARRGSRASPLTERCFHRWWAYDRGQDLVFYISADLVMGRSLTRGDHASGFSICFIFEEAYGHAGGTTATTNNPDMRRVVALV